MKREDIEAFHQRIMPYLERQDDKKELEAVCRMALAFVDACEQNAESASGTASNS